MAPKPDSISALTGTVTTRTIRRVAGGAEIVGIVGNCERTPLDECGHVYKDLDVVLQVLEDNGIARMAHRLWPIANLKGSD